MSEDADVMLFKLSLLCRLATILLKTGTMDYVEGNDQPGGMARNLVLGCINAGRF